MKMRLDSYNKSALKAIVTQIGWQTNTRSTENTITEDDEPLAWSVE